MRKFDVLFWIKDAKESECPHNRKIAETDKYNNCVGICPLLAGVSFVSFKTADIVKCDIIK